MNRNQKIAKARELREQGLTLKAIGAEFGVKLQTVHDWLNDPDGSKKKARQAQYGRDCLVCGARTNGKAGSGKAPEVCGKCAPDFYRYWTRERIIERMREWGEQYGRPPSALDWNPWRAALSSSSVTEETAARKMQRFKEGNWPHAYTVQKVFGSWSAGLAAAGLSSNPTGYAGRWENVEAA